MDRWRKKRNTWGGDSLEFWYLSGGVSGDDVIAAYKFIHAESEAKALMNVNPEVYYPLLKVQVRNWYTSDIQPESFSGFTSNGFVMPAYCGLNNAALSNTNIVSAVMRVKINGYEAVDDHGSGYLLNPTLSYHLVAGLSWWTEGNGENIGHSVANFVLFGESGSGYLRFGTGEHINGEYRNEEYIICASEHKCHIQNLSNPESPIYHASNDHFGTDGGWGTGVNTELISTIGPVCNESTDCVIKALAFYNKDISDSDFESIAKKIMQL